MNYPVLPAIELTPGDAYGLASAPAEGGAVLRLVVPEVGIDVAILVDRDAVRAFAHQLLADVGDGMHRTVPHPSVGGS